MATNKNSVFRGQAEPGNFQAGTFNDTLGLTVPPHSIEAESAILGGLLLSGKTLEQVSDSLVEGDFYRAENQIIFKAIKDLDTLQKTVDVVTVFEHLKERQLDDVTGGLMYLDSLAQFVPAEANLRRYAEIVQERSLQRQLIRAGSDIIQSAINTEGDSIESLLDKVEQRVMEISEKRGRAGDNFEDFKELMIGVMDRMQAAADNKGVLAGQSTGFKDLDKMTNGLHPGDLTIIAGRPSMGKTALAINIAEHIGIYQKKPVAIFSLEMSSSQLANRIVSSSARVNQQSLINGNITNDEVSRFSQLSDDLVVAPIFIDDGSSPTMANIRANSRRLNRKCGGLSLIVVDYLQLITPAGDGDTRAISIGDMSRGLKMLAMELKCPVIVLSQLNRSVESRVDKRPLMSDLRDSGSIEQDADIVLFLYRDEYYTKEMCKEPGIAEVIISKHRNGPTGTVRLAFRGEYTRFDTLESGQY